MIETAEKHMSRWAEQENVFTRFLPYAIVFDVDRQVGEGVRGPRARHHRGHVAGTCRSRPFVYHEFADSIGSFAVTTSGTIASTPAGSGGSGFGGGGFSGGGGGGGGGGSW